MNIASFSPSSILLTHHSDSAKNGKLPENEDKFQQSDELK